MNTLVHIVLSSLHSIIKHQIQCDFNQAEQCKIYRSSGFMVCAGWDVKTGLKTILLLCAAVEVLPPMGVSH